MPRRIVLYSVFALVLALAWGLAFQILTGPPDADQTGFAFHDDLQSNSDPKVALADLAFLDPSGEEFALRNLIGQRKLVVVVTRGNTGAICPYCSTQTSRLISNYDEFRRRDAEVVVVYPIETQEDSGSLDRFLEITRKRLLEPDEPVPFPFVLDVGLAAVDELGIRALLAKPATYILDKKGRVRFAYVGASLADRPSIKAMLAQLDALN